MRWMFLILLLFSVNAFSQWKDYKLNPQGDTLNRIDVINRKQGPWVNRYETVRGEPGYEEEGWYVHNRKDGEWRLFSLQGDLVGVEFYKWGLKDSVCRYYNKHGELRLEQRWKAINPDKLYDTLMIEDPDKFDTYRAVIIKNEGASLRHGLWKYFDSETGMVSKTESYVLGELEKAKSQSTAPTAKKEIAKPKEVLDFEKKNAGKKKVRVRDGSTGN
ncbi:hypothetical protein [Paraflavitalea sp. CAU 1676]|uniref:toxin-antitoxin system YwqK family antitoxin n=1 Tax=Paraflavitalea sp. CAU 1676 TaxID=3032598 RepID=UPI0023DC46C8|nr:hypothetical protein [Paraflavitalea sp. CAU 1676]MDF2190122.1 hypothetical protein [Paraflavitalea sp. CAU 1676]